MAGLTPKQRAFCEAVALHNQSHAAAYVAAYDTGKMTPKTISEEASRLAADPKLSAEISVLRAGATAVAVQKAGYSLADAMAAAKKAEDLAHSVGQAGGAVSAVTLQAKLAGHLTESKEKTTKGMLDDMDVAGLMAVKAEVEAKIQANRDALGMVGEAPEPIAAPVLRRVIA